MANGRRWAAVMVTAAIVGGLAGITVQRLWPAPATVPAWPVVGVVHRVQAAVVTVLNEQSGPQGLTVKGIGSGVIIRPNGVIVTNYHVIAGASRVVVAVQGGGRFAARVLGSDPPTDLAVLQIPAAGSSGALRSLPSIHPMPLAVHPPQPGELVVAIGSALGLSHSVTVGVISGLDRLLYRDGWEFRLIQTDAAINPGNSGGALVDAQGRLVGINSSKIAKVGVEGIGFAVPAPTVRFVVDEILRYGQVRRPWLGAVVQAAPGGPGLFVVSVVPGGPAAQAGLQAGDWLLAAGGQRLIHLHDLTRVLEGSPVGHRLELTVLRGGQRLTLHPRLALAPSGGQRSPSSAAVAPGAGHQ